MLLRDQLRQFIRDSFLVDDFADDESFLGSAIIDSLGILQVVSFVEERFGIQVADTDLKPDNFDSVNKLVAYIERRLREKAA